VSLCGTASVTQPSEAASLGSWLAPLPVLTAAVLRNRHPRGFCSRPVLVLSSPHFTLPSKVPASSRPLASYFRRMMWLKSCMCQRSWPARDCLGRQCLSTPCVYRRHGMAWRGVVCQWIGELSSEFPCRAAGPTQRTESNSPTRNEARPSLRAGPSPSLDRSGCHEEGHVRKGASVSAPLLHRSHRAFDRPLLRVPGAMGLSWLGGLKSSS
jgi:hypothetical protein